MYRSFRSGDEIGIIELWNKVLNRDPINASRFRKQVLLDANFDPNGLIVAVQEERIVGAILAITRKLPMEGTNLESDTGWITFFMVEAGYERKGIGHKLVERACQYIKDQGAEKVFFSSYAPNYFLPGIDEERYSSGYAFLRKEKFKRVYSPVAMHRVLTNYEYPLNVLELKKQREQEGYSFGRVQDGDLYALIQFANIHFNPDWGRAIREGILQGMDPSQILVAKKHNNIVGFALYGGYEGIRERFGPFGVDENEQGKGLGKILLHETLQAMREQTILGAWFLWTSETSAAGHLYLKNGFQTFRKFHVMVKELTNGQQE
ncbi:GNAT family N-acetyltransferase [Psychrobacillus sp. NEAU-3TGS]|uniref:GNAT family N-acetyltransferase n=1 Tax=Psychrobacillus sp. NEAU-3TGS TaxID=2995412 RepID=UPI002496F45F|nr:GNAT family N-acetyltransferase [Psychrobacillus sp. NEAU-3TGS]MDI2587182.1 GNAT family N-acetyltransferase [Psychrobacillus sp. NEAU-3TGS]